MTEPHLPELFSHAIDDEESGLHADVLMPQDDDAPLTPERATDNFATSVKTMLKAGDDEEAVLDVYEQAFGFRPTPGQWAAFKKKHGIE